LRLLTKRPATGHRNGNGAYKNGRDRHAEVPALSPPPSV